MRSVPHTILIASRVHIPAMTAVVVIPASVQIIESKAFDHCDALRMLVFDGSPAQIAEEMGQDDCELPF